MPFEGVFSIISELKKKIVYIFVLFGAGAVISFSYMGEVIKKIESDMFYGMSIPDKPDASKQLFDISNNLSTISKQLADNNSIIAQNLSGVSGELLNISRNLNLYNPNIIYLTPMEVVMLEFKMSIIFGILIASPLIMFYAYRGARKQLANINLIQVKTTLVVSTILASLALFLVGASYAYFYMLPFFLEFLYKDAMSLGINANFSIYEFISFIVLTTVILGFAFELPVILTFLVHLGVISRKTLTHYRKHAIVILLIIAAWITPDPTMLTQVMVALPFIILYEASLVVMRLTGK